MFSPHAYVTSGVSSTSLPASLPLSHSLFLFWMSERAGACPGRWGDWMLAPLVWVGGIRVEWEWEKLCFQGWAEPSGEFALSSSRPSCWCITITIKGAGHGGKVLFLSSLPPILLIGKQILSKLQYSHLLLFLWCRTAVLWIVCSPVSVTSVVWWQRFMVHGYF